MKLTKIIIILFISVNIVACYDVPIAPESEAYIENKLLGHWERTDVRQFPEDKIDRIVLPPWAEFEKYDKNPNWYWVKHENTIGQVDYQKGYSVRFDNKVFLVFWLSMQPDSPPVNYKIWFLDFHGANKVKVYSLILPNKNSIKSVEEFQKQFIALREKSYFYEATYERTKDQS